MLTRQLFNRMQKENAPLYILMAFRVVLFFMLLHAIFFISQMCGRCGPPKKADGGGISLKYQLLAMMPVRSCAIFTHLTGA